ncbi:YqaJ viral recombinase family protein [Corynebacterium parakroppenstedtii]|uniref:YqaJ viral recombinase family protein n=1 Tax=Corynebacterium parakroppenstedtii TaxID=2828363 RepID=UPI001C8F77E1|nr:YqaJ viral recombinase family protein [Corynebacterium parakroppenstedtii]MBY0795025.1 YqaJ viral recombinase family protein [Corynebacterium parakroppenstedtii]
MSEKQCRLLEFDSEQEWLEARKRYFTATMMADLATGGSGARERVYRDRHGLSKPFAGNSYTQWGHERETVLVNYAREHVDSRLEHNTGLYVSTQIEGAACTPDAVGCREDGTVAVLAEAKTTKNMWWKREDVPDRYLWQIQWQLLVTGAEACVLVFEYHEDFVPQGVDYFLIRPDKDTQERLLALLARQKDFEAEHVEARLPDFFADRVCELSKLKAQARELEDRLKAEIKEFTGGKDFSYSDDRVQVTLSTPKRSSRFDTAGFKRAEPELYERFVKPGKDPSQRVTLKWKGAA